MCNGSDNYRGVNVNIRKLQSHMSFMITWECLCACYFFWRRTAFTMFPLHQSQSETTSMGCTDVPDLIWVGLLKREEKKKSSSCLLPTQFHFCFHFFAVFLLLSPAPSRLHRSPSNCWGSLFMSPGSDALASKLCKCILPVKLKPSLLVLRGLLHRVLHHSFGSGPLHFPP